MSDIETIDQLKKILEISDERSDDGEKRVTEKGDADRRFSVHCVTNKENTPVRNTVIERKQQEEPQQQNQRQPQQQQQTNQQQQSKHQQQTKPQNKAQQQQPKQQTQQNQPKQQNQVQQRKQNQLEQKQPESQKLVKKLQLNEVSFIVLTKECGSSILISIDTYPPIGKHNQKFTKITNICGFSKDHRFS